MRGVLPATGSRGPVRVTNQDMPIFLHHSQVSLPVKLREHQKNCRRPQGSLTTSRLPAGKRQKTMPPMACQNFPTAFRHKRPRVGEGWHRLGGRHSHAQSGGIQIAREHPHHIAKSFLVLLERQTPRLHEPDFSSISHDR